MIFPPFQAPPCFMHTRDIGELRDEVGLTHFKKLLQCFNLNLPVNFLKIVIYYDFPPCHLSRVRVSLKPLKDPVPNNPMMWMPFPQPSMTQQFLTYSRQQKNVASASPTQSSMISKTQKILMWNVWRSSSSNFFIFLVDLIREYQPMILILIEAPQPDHGAKLLQEHHGFSNFKYVEPMYRRGGLWYFWKFLVNTIDFISTKSSLFHSLLTLAPDEPEVLLTAMHAPRSSAQRPSFWNNLAQDPPP